MQPRPLRILAIDLTAKGIGFVLIDARLGLLDWGFSALPADDDAVFLERVSIRIERGHPTALVLENFAPIKGREGAMHRRDLAIALAADLRIGSCQVSQKVVQRILGLRTKAQIAKALAERFPELRHRMPRERTCWSTEDERMHIFDALALAVAVLKPWRPLLRS